MRAPDLHNRHSEGEQAERHPLEMAQPTAEHEDGSDRRRDHLHLRGDRRGDRVQVRERVVPKVILQRVAQRGHCEHQRLARVLQEEPTDLLGGRPDRAQLIYEQQHGSAELKDLGERHGNRRQIRGLQCA